jgi:hypothetical protein
VDGLVLGRSEFHFGKSWIRSPRRAGSRRGFRDDNVNAEDAELKPGATKGACYWDDSVKN